jgi:cell division septum initiation protein DivIVA
MAIDRTVTEAAGAIAEMHDVFERLRSLLVVAREDHDNEVKIGELFVRAQDHVNEALADAEERTRQLLADAEVEAARIVAAAKQEAHRLLEEARQPTLAPSVTEQLQRTIDGFARVNGELQSELTSLVRTLSESAPRPSTPPTASPGRPAAESSGDQGQGSDPTSNAPPPPPPPAPTRGQPAFIPS